MEVPPRRILWTQNDIFAAWGHPRGARMWCELRSNLPLNTKLLAASWGGSAPRRVHGLQACFIPRAGQKLESHGFLLIINGFVGISDPSAGCHTQ